MAEDRVAEVRRLDQIIASSRSEAAQAEVLAMRQWVPLLVDEMQSTAELFGRPFEEVLTEYYFGDHKIRLMMKRGSLFGELRNRAPRGDILMFFERVFNEELESRNVVIRLRTDGSWYGTTFYKV